MRIVPCELPGASVIEPQMNEDERGSFGRVFCRREFEKAGLCAAFVQSSTSFNRRKGTLRGLHFQLPPFAETKLVRCTRGAVFDVIVDLRRESATYCRHFSIELTEENRKAVYVPQGFAHGFQTMTDNAEVFYEISEFYEPGKAAGVRWNDPAFSIPWPEEGQRIISPRDSSYGDFLP